MKIDSFTEKDTFEVGRHYGAMALPGGVICLDGDLGAGKTVFVKGFAKGLEVKENISSPTFTIINEYDSGRIPLYHFDVYRLEDETEAEEIGAEEYFYGDGVCLIEWASVIEKIIPESAVRIRITRNPSMGEDYRLIETEEQNA